MLATKVGTPKERMSDGQDVPEGVFLLQDISVALSSEVAAKAYVVCLNCRSTRHQKFMIL